MHAHVDRLDQSVRCCGILGHLFGGNDGKGKPTNQISA